MGAAAGGVAGGAAGAEEGATAANAVRQHLAHAAPHKGEEFGGIMGRRRDGCDSAARAGPGQADTQGLHGPRADGHGGRRGNILEDGERLGGRRLRRVVGVLARKVLLRRDAHRGQRASEGSARQSAERQQRIIRSCSCDQGPHPERPQHHTAGRAPRRPNRPRGAACRAARRSRALPS
eukprot:641758-Prymnesium_polylepis.1